MDFWEVTSGWRKNHLS